MTKSDDADAGAVKVAFASYPVVKDVMASMPDARFVGMEETVGLNVTPRRAYEQMPGLLEIPRNSTDASVLVRPEDFAAWIRLNLSDVDFSEGCSFWAHVELPGNRGLPWMKLELDHAEDLLPLWFALRAQVVIIYSPANYCLVAFYEAERRWEFYRQP